MKLAFKVLFYYIFFVIWVIIIAGLNAYAISAIAVKSIKGTVISILLIVLWWGLTFIFNVIDKKEITKTKK